MLLVQYRNELLNRFRVLANKGTELRMYQQVAAASYVTAPNFPGNRKIMNLFTKIVRDLEKAKKLRSKNDYATFLMSYKPKARDRIEEAAAAFLEAVAIESLAMNKEALEGGFRKIFGHPATVIVPDAFWKETAQDSIDAMKRVVSNIETVIDRSGEDEYFGAIVESGGKDMNRRLSDEAFKTQSGIARRVQGYAGGTKYIWRTMKDLRVVGTPGGLYPVGNDVHGNHYDREGKVFEWANPPFDGHPGTAPGCRCQAIPLIGVNNPEIQ